MEILLIQIKDQKAYKLLKDLEDLQLLKVLDQDTPSKIDYSKKYAGSISNDVAEEMQEYVKKSRDEWKKPT